MNEWLRLVTLSHTNCCRGTEQQYQLRVSVINANGSSLVRSFKWCLEQYCFQVVPKHVQWQDSPDARWQRVSGTCCCHWKGSVTDHGPAGWRHSNCWCAGWSGLSVSSIISFTLQPNCEVYSKSESGIYLKLARFIRRGMRYLKFGKQLLNHQNMA